MIYVLVHDHANRYLELYTDLARMRESYLIAVKSGKNPVEFAGYMAELHVSTIKHLAGRYPNVVSTYFGCSRDISTELSEGEYDISYVVEDADIDGNVHISFTLSCNNVKYKIKRDLL